MWKYSMNAVEAAMFVAGAAGMAKGTNSTA